MEKQMDACVPHEKPRLDLALNNLTGTTGVLAGVVAAEDGLPIAVRLRSDQNGEVWAAAASAMGRIGRKVLAKLSKGELQVGVFDTDRYRLLVRPISLGYLLAVCEPETNIGLVTMELEASANALDQSLALIAPRAAADPVYRKGAEQP